MTKIHLSGIDFFQVLVDHHIRRKKGPGHVTRLAIFLKGKLEKEQLEQVVLENELCQQIARLRLDSHWGLGYSTLYFTQGRGGSKPPRPSIPIDYQEILGKNIPSELLNAPLDFHKKPPLAIQVLYFKNEEKTCLLFSFHHTVFDHAGVQALIHALNGKTGVPLFPPKPLRPPFSERFKAFFRAIGFAFKEGNASMTAIEKPLPRGSQRRIVFREIVFTKEETAAISANSKAHGTVHHRSAFLLACTCKALHDGVFSQQKKHSFLWAPVPVNFRKKGGQDAVLLNGLSFLFYKLKPADLANLEASVSAIQQQMREQMRRQLPQAFLEFTNGYRFVPLPIYYPMFNLPSWGKLSTFSFSSLGESFSGLEHFLGLPVLDIQHFPSNFIVPGLTVVFYEFRGQLRLMSSWVAGQFSGEEQAGVLAAMKVLLLSTR
jgi:hypothetical protein